MLLEEFDNEKNALINAEMIVEKVDNFPDIAIACFSHRLCEKVIQFLASEKILGKIGSTNGTKPVYEVKYKGKRFAFYMASVGEPLCIGDIEEVSAMGAKRFILLGNCGVLDPSIEDCGILIPTQALRDEGCSFHYAPPTDSIEVNKKYREWFKEIITELGYPYVEGITWTTDAFYRETKAKVQKRKQQGAICVEMECAGLQAVCDFRGKDFFQFFYAGDQLDHSSWNPRSLAGSTKLDEKTKIAILAFELGVKILEETEKI